MIKYKSMFKYLIITLLIAASLSGVKIEKVNAADIEEPYNFISNYITE